jgi:hypothetical protein
MKLSDFWHREFVVFGGDYRACGLCGNHGVIDTRGVKTPAGMDAGGLFYCICPNGRALKKAEVSLEAIVEGRR